MLSRRSILGGTLCGLTAGCAFRSKNAFVGSAFVATRDSGDIAVVDLAAFRLNTSRIKPSGRPVQLLDVPNSDFFYTVGDNGIVEEVSVTESAISRKLKIPIAPQDLWLSFDAKTLWALSADGKRLLAIDRARLDLKREWKLPERATAIAVAPETAHVAVALSESSRVGILGPGAMNDFAWASIGDTPGLIRFLNNGSMLLVAQRAKRQLTMVDTTLGKVVVHLPLPIQPENLCFSADGGQLFITGEGLDGVVVVYPYQSQVAATLLSGKAPGPMAVSSQPQFLFVTSPSTDTVSVLDYRTQKLAAVVAVGNDPRCVVLTPDNQMALVLNQRSGDMAIIRLANIVSKRHKTAPLFTLIPVGSAPVAAVVRTA